MTIIQEPLAFESLSLDLPLDLAVAGCAARIAPDGARWITLPDGRTCDAPPATFDADAWPGLCAVARRLIAAAEQQRAALEDDERREAA